MKRILFILPILFLLAACDTPWENSKTRAQADAIRTNADIKSAESQQALEHQQELDAIAVMDEEIAHADKLAHQAQWQKSINTLINFGMFASTIALTVMILSSGIAFGVAAIGKGRAVALVALEAQTLKINLIPLDVKTHQYPLLRQIQNGKWALMNPNTGANYLLDEQREADRQLISAMQSVQYIGELSTQTRQSKDRAAESMSMLNVPIIAARDGDLIISKDVIEGIAS